MLPTGSVAPPSPAQGGEPPAPWWRKTGPVAAITTILAAVIPVTTGVWGLIQKDRELAAQKANHDHEAAMEELRLKHSIRMDILDRVKTQADRSRTLRMVEETSEDPKMVAWAKSERDAIDIDVKAMEERVYTETEEKLKPLAGGAEAIAVDPKSSQLVFPTYQCNVALVTCAKTGASDCLDKYKACAISSARK
jgi:hypothetical protein